MAFRNGKTQLILSCSHSQTRTRIAEHSLSWAGLPLCLIALAAGYLRHTQFQTRNAVLLFAANLALAALSFVEGPEHLTFFIALPAWWGWKCVTEATNLVPTQ
jgi:hypothetical protein